MADYSGAYSAYTPPKDAYSAHTRLDALEKRVDKLETARPPGAKITTDLLTKIDELEKENEELRNKLAGVKGLLDG